jgi:hypothetical protein
MVGIIIGKTYEHEHLRLEPVGPKHAPIKWKIHDHLAKGVEEFTNKAKVLESWMSKAWGSDWQIRLQKP